MEAAARIAEADPELVKLLDGSANGNARADALSGKLSAVAPTLEETRAAAKQKRIQELYDSKPYRDGKMVSMFNALELDELAPEVGARARREANYEHPQERDARLAKEEQAKQQWHQQMAAQAQLKRLQDQAAGRF